ncbi:hypothetical protein F2Q69_00012155 [Brassica cretica]|uniref:Uncharacterized protein n=1 Tax=Brassica cretica TaxID=69181 RepID=A0A8S9R825_BRACR|nr:hypothetical protein F2Q69_00012155 [Brassica cretica]
MWNVIVCQNFKDKGENKSGILPGSEDPNRNRSENIDIPTVQCTGSTYVRPERSFGWNHDQTTELTVPELVFPDHLNILRTIVEPDLSWVVKNPNTDMHSHLADHPDSPACVLLLTALDTTNLDEPGQ